MGYGIPNTSWTDGYAYLKLPITSAGEILPQDPHTFYYTLIQGTTYTQTIWFETDATVKDLSVAQITWFTNAHDYQPAMVKKLGQNSYKLVSTYTWPSKSSNNVRLFDIGGFGNAFDVSTGTYLKFGKLKLEQGSLATDWSLNPEDQATQSQITQLSNDINLRVTKNGLLDQINLQAGKTLISSSGQLTLSANSVFLDSANPVIMKSANIDKLLVGKKLTAADIAANTFTTNNGTFTVDSNGLVTATSLIIRGSTNLVYNSALSGGNGSYIPGWNMNGEGYYSNTVLYDGLPAIAWASTATGWDNYATTYYQPVTQTGIPYSASGTFRDYGSASGMSFQCALAFFTDKNSDSRISGFKGFNYTATGGDSGSIYFTIDNVVAPSNAKYVALQFWAYNGKGHVAWSQPMLTQTAHSTGYQPDAGNVVSAGTVLGTTISGSTINATTFNGGDVLSDANNTSKFYPFTIESNGKASTTVFNSMDALRTEMSGGGITTKYRATNSSGTTYEAYDGVFDGNMISLNSGFTNGKDMSFSQAVSGNNLTGQVTLSPLTGINLWGSTQSIHFSGLHMNGTGISFNSYGNIIGDNGSTWFRIIDSAGNQTANFGTAPGNNTTFPKPIFVDQVGAYSTSNGGALLLCDNKGTSQIALRNDGNPQIVSSTIYNRTYSSGSTVTVTSYGTMGRITSASKYKLAIAREPQIEPADRLLTIDPSSWVDLEGAKAVAESKSDGKVLLEHEQSLDRHHGLIAEDLRDAGLGEFVIYGMDGEIEGIQYDRLWTILIPKIKQLNERLNELERKSI